MSGRRVAVERRPPALTCCFAVPDPDPVRQAAATALRRRQLRTGLATTALVAATLAALPALTAGATGPWTWLLVSAGAHLAWIVLAVAQVRRAERLER
ncbi:hypothetical protein [Nonomuraea sp. NPDC050310]|uniref:hypothetical protein n=1 Tax=unclassified Nonomuraea TaxID=2593643 RepID=UPI0033DD2E68